MASPTAATAEMEVKSYVGNGLNLNLTGNENLSFIVIGNNCDVNLRDNLASIQMIGNNCTLHVLSGGGTVQYIGNDGTIYLGKGIDEDVVTYTGNNGRIIPEGGTIRPSEIVSPIAATFVTEIKPYVGDNLNLDLKGNTNLSFVVVGNTCDVQLRDNLTSIQMVGNNCTLRVYSGGGRIFYVGNDGTIYLDRSIDKKVVTFIGNNVTIAWMSSTTQRRSSVDDARKIAGSMEVIDMNGVCTISIPNVRTAVRTFMHIGSTISLPNIQQVSGPINTTPSTDNNLAIHDAEDLPSLIN